MTGFRVVLDACVLAPIHKVDLLLTFAGQRAFFPLWSHRGPLTIEGFVEARSASGAQGFVCENAPYFEPGA